MQITNYLLKENHTSHQYHVAQVTSSPVMLLHLLPLLSLLLLSVHVTLPAAAADTAAQASKLPPTQKKAFLLRQLLQKYQQATRQPTATRILWSEVLVFGCPFDLKERHPARLDAQSVEELISVLPNLVMVPKVVNETGGKRKRRPGTSYYSQKRRLLAALTDPEQPSLPAPESNCIRRRPKQQQLPNPTLVETEVKFQEMKDEIYASLLQEFHRACPEHASSRIIGWRFVHVNGWPEQVRNFKQSRWSRQAIRAIHAALPQITMTPRNSPPRDSSPAKCHKLPRGLSPVRRHVLFQKVREIATALGCMRGPYINWDRLQTEMVGTLGLTTTSSGDWTVADLEILETRVVAWYAEKYGRIVEAKQEKDFDEDVVDDDEDDVDGNEGKGVNVDSEGKSVNVGNDDFDDEIFNDFDSISKDEIILGKDFECDPFLEAFDRDEMKHWHKKGNVRYS